MSEHLSENSAMESIAVAIATVNGRSNLTVADVRSAEAVVSLLQNYPEVAVTFRITGKQKPSGPHTMVHNDMLRQLNKHAEQRTAALLLWQSSGHPNQGCNCVGCRMATILLGLEQ